MGVKCIREAGICYSNQYLCTSQTIEYDHQETSDLHVETEDLPVGLVRIRVSVSSSVEEILQPQNIVQSANVLDESAH